MGCCPIRCRQDIAAQVVGVGIGLAAAHRRGKLVQVIIGVGINRTVFRIGSDIAQLIVGIAEAGSVRKAGVAQAAYLGSGLGIVNIPVGVALSVDIPGGDGGNAAQTVIAQANGLAQGVLVAAQGSVASVVGIGLLIGAIPDGPGLLGDLVGGVVPQLGAQDREPSPVLGGYVPRQRTVPCLTSHLLLKEKAFFRGLGIFPSPRWGELWG